MNLFSYQEHSSIRFADSFDVAGRFVLHLNFKAKAWGTPYIERISIQNPRMGEMVYREMDWLPIINEMLQEYPGPTKEKLIVEIKNHLAGDAAMCLALPQFAGDPKKYWKQVLTPDLKGMTRVMQCLSYLGREGDLNYLYDLFLDTVAEARRLWDVVEDFSEVILNCVTIEGDELERVSLEYQNRLAQMKS